MSSATGANACLGLCFLCCLPSSVPPVLRGQHPPARHPAMAAPDLTLILFLTGTHVPFDCRELEGVSDWDAGFAKDAEIASLRQRLEVRAHAHARSK